MRRNDRSGLWSTLVHVDGVDPTQWEQSLPPPTRPIVLVMLSVRGCSGVVTAQAGSDARLGRRCQAQLDSGWVLAGQFCNVELWVKWAKQCGLFWVKWCGLWVRLVSLCWLFFHCVRFFFFGLKWGGGDQSRFDTKLMQDKLMGEIQIRERKRTKANSNKVCFRKGGFVA